MVMKYSDWHRPYRALFQESDPQKLAGLVNVVETTMFFRLRELSTSSDGLDERQAIAQAASTLLTIKREILGFPGLEFIDQKEARAGSEPD
jgi:hypothetical protein